jgi:hypothetical protein
MCLVARSLAGYHAAINLSFSKLTVASAVCVESRTPATTFRILAFAVLAGKLASNPHHVLFRRLPKSFAGW